MPLRISSHRFTRLPQTVAGGGLPAAMYRAARMPAVVTACCLLLTACGQAPTEVTATDGIGQETVAAESVRPTPRYPDGSVRFDRAPGERGYWARPSKSSLVETGADIAFDARGLLVNPEDAPRVAPFMDWSLALYRYRQANGLADDPVRACISPAGPRHLHDPGGFRIIQDRNFDRVYVLFGGGNRGWRLIHMDGREPPNPDEVTGSYYGYSTGQWQGDTLVVESSGFNDRFWFSQGGLPHTPGLQLTERFSRPTHDTLLYQVTIDDPRTYTRPWNAEWTLQWVDGDIEERFCEQ